MTEKDNGQNNISDLIAFASLLQLRARIAETKPDSDIKLNAKERKAVISAIDEIEMEIEKAQLYAEATEAQLLDTFAGFALGGLVREMNPENAASQAYRFAGAVLNLRKTITEGRLDQRLKEAREEKKDGANAGD